MNESLHVIDVNGKEIFIRQENDAWNRQYCENVVDAYRQDTGIESSVVAKPIFAQFTDRYPRDN